MIKIDKKIKEVRVEDPSFESHSIANMNEDIKRPDKLFGATYKLKVPDHVSPHAMYVTINNYVLNEGTSSETIRPFEIFINSKSTSDHQWIVTITRVLSAVFRKGGDVMFILDEFKSVYDPSGGYFNKGKFQNSIICELGDIIEEHFKSIGLYSSDENEVGGEVVVSAIDSTIPAKNMARCKKCEQFSVVREGGCNKCLECGDSACG